MASRWYSITADAHRVLTDSAAYDGPRVTITEQVGPDAWTKTKTVLEKLGAVYAIGTSAFDFEPDQDAHAIVTAALAAGRVMGAANADGYVSTPADLAADLVGMYGELSPPTGRPLRVLEPSAGVGRFVQAITRDLSPVWLDLVAVEPDARRARQIPTHDGRVSVVVDTFERYAERTRAAGGRFDVVIMNPPFSVPGRPTVWADHLLTAWELLAPGGRLLAILPASALDRRRAGRTHQAAAELIHTHGAGELLERDAFAESGIIFQTAAVWLDRPLTDERATVLPSPLRSYVFRAYTGAEVPAPVSRPLLTRGAAFTTPVQVWRDAWRNRDRVLRYCAECAVCSLPTWAFDDGGNDPRGVLGNAAAHPFDPYDYDHAGALPVAMCAMCANDYDAYRRGLTLARRVWADTAAALADTASPATVDPPAGPGPDTAARVSPWISEIEQLSLTV